MRPVWKGAISFGLVNIPINLMSAEDPAELKFSMMDSKDHAKIKYQRINADTGKEVAWEDIVKAYEFPDGSYVIVTDEDFEKADPKASKTFEIEEFVAAKELNPMYLEKPYYVAPVKGGEKPYVLLRDAMVQSGKVAIGRVTIRTKQSIGALLPVDEALVLILLRYAEELRGVEGLNLPEDAKISDKEMELALSLIDGLTKKWDPDEFRNEYADALKNRIEAKAKLKGKELPDEEEETEVTPSNVVDIMDLLRKSVESKGKTDSKGKSTAKEKSAASEKAEEDETETETETEEAVEAEATGTETKTPARKASKKSVNSTAKSTAKPAAGTKRKSS